MSYVEDFRRGRGRGGRGRRFRRRGRPWGGGPRRWTPWNAYYLPQYYWNYSPYYPVPECQCQTVNPDTGLMCTPNTDEKCFCFDTCNPGINGGQGWNCSSPRRGGSGAVAGSTCNMVESYEKCGIDDEGNRTCDDCDWENGECVGTCVEPNEACSGQNAVCICR